jgi:HlyD family secretion protein
MKKDYGTNIPRRKLTMSNNNAILRFRQNRPFILIAVVSALAVIGIGAVIFAASKANHGSTSNLATFVVKRGPLRISVTESGTIKARDQLILKNEVEGVTSILSLIPEGTRVKEGDLLVELDASQLLDAKIDQQIKVQNTEAAFIGARENLAVVENQARSDVDIAKLNLKFARQDLKQYKEGEYPTQQKQANGLITLAQEEVTRAQEKFDWSKTLFEEKYISQTELKADELALARKNLDLQLSESNLNLLQNFTYQRNLDQLRSDVNQADMALERSNRKARADVVQAEAELKAKESEYGRQSDKLQKNLEQTEKTKIYAPADGLAIYATSARRGSWRSRTEPLDVGQTVRERQELIYLPTASAVKAEVDIHETSLKKVRVGLPAIITIDALPGKIFLGTVEHIAPLPDAQSMWLNPDLKVYNSEIYVDGNDSTLRTGMSCKAEIVIAQYPDATYVPVQAVLRIAGEPTVYVVNGKNIQPRMVEIGLDNNRMVRIMSGLQEGEVVLLTPPLKSAAVEPYAGKIGTETSPLEDNTEAIYRTINDRLQNITNSGQSAGQRTPGTHLKGRQERDDGRRGKSGRDRMEPGQRQKMGRRSENMSSEEREKLRKRFEKMSPEEREKMRQQRRDGNR